MSSPDIPAACCLCYGQANVQAALRPGSWLPFVRRFHQYREEWHLAANLSVALPQVTQASAAALSKHGTVLQVNRIQCRDSQAFLQLLCFSRFRFLDVLELRFRVYSGDGSDKEETPLKEISMGRQEKERIPISGGCVVEARSFRSGLLPVSVPLAPLWNVLLFWLPHGDGGSNRQHLRTLRENLHLDVTVLARGRPDC